MATCVDEKEGIFLIRHSSKGGMMYPTNVKKVMDGKNAGVGCAITECMDFMRAG